MIILSSALYFMITLLELVPVKVLCVRSLYKDVSEIPEASKKAFADLESKLPVVNGKRVLKGRKFYGAINNGEYMACFSFRQEDDTEKMDLEKWEIPRGRYARTVIENWTNNRSKIGPAFGEMEKMYKRDGSRPLIEFYRSHTELVLMMPVKSA